MHQGTPPPRRPLPPAAAPRGGARSRGPGRAPPSGRVAGGRHLPRPDAAVRPRIAATERWGVREILAAPTISPRCSPARTTSRVASASPQRDAPLLTGAPDAPATPRQAPSSTCPVAPPAPRPAGRADRRPITDHRWLQVLTQTKNSGLEDVCIVVCDGLKGLPDSLSMVWLQAVTQTCAVHLTRASFRYAGRQNRDKVSRALKPVYTAPTASAAEYLGVKHLRDSFTRRTAASLTDVGCDDPHGAGDGVVFGHILTLR
ncbi:transposase [Streptomyces sp. NPDC001848]|uniref:transposase n=1 Tax=Streptomyces sp. NPDC001848 TaxID=3364618 RepID=UPI0036C9B8FB